jgi:hypothetical protein
MIAFAICSTLSNSFSVRTRKRCVPCSSRPPDRLTFSARMRRVTTSIESAQLCELLLVDEDLHFVLVTATHLDCSRTFDRFEVGFQPVLGKASQRLEPLDAVGAGRGAFVHQREAHDRFARRVEAQQQGPLGFDRQLQQVELLADVDARDVHVRAPEELERHVRLARARNRTHLADVADDAHGLFDGPRDQRLEFQRRRAGQFRADRDGGIGEVGQQVQLEPRERHEAEQGDGDGEHHDGDAAFDREVDQ